MTDIADLTRKALAAREFTVPVGAASFTLRLPTEHEKRVASLRARGVVKVGERPNEDPAFNEVVLRALLEAAVVQWSGITADMLAPGGGTEAVDVVPGAAALLLDNQPETAQALTLAFIYRMADREQHAQELEKN